MSNRQQLETRATEIIAEAGLAGYSLESFLRRAIAEMAIEHAADETGTVLPPRTVSARVFRLSFGDLAEPVSVVLRTREAGLVLLGSWKPAPGHLGGRLPANLGVPVKRRRKMAAR